MPKYRSDDIIRIFSSNDYKNLLLPNFQRSFKWSRDKQKGLLASLFSDIPIGSFLFLQGSGGEFASRELCEKEGNKISSNTCIYLLDGQQRLSTIKSALYPVFNKDSWRETLSNTYSDLHNVWFLNLYAEDISEDIFGWYKLNFNPNNILFSDPDNLYHYFEFRKIFKHSNSEEWYHPNYYNILSKNGYGHNQIEGTISDYSATNNLVPINRILDDDDAIQERVLHKIAQKRSQVLQDKISDNSIAIEELYDDISSDQYESLDNSDKIRFWSKKESNWAEQLNNYLNNVSKNQLPIIFLEENELSRAVSIFSHLNKGGTPLSPYDLIVASAATYMHQDESLNRKIISSIKSTISLPPSIDENILNNREWSPVYMDPIDDNIPKSIIQNQFLNILSLEVYINNKYLINEIDSDKFKKQHILSISPRDIYDNYKNAINTLLRCLAFCQFRCGIQNIGKLNYELMMLPIAICLRDDAIWQDIYKINNLEYWYWTSLFSGRYRERQNNRSISDIKNMYQWIVMEEINNPYEDDYDYIMNNIGYSDFSRLIRDYPDNEPPDKAVYDGILQFILRERPNDLITTNESPRLYAYGASKQEEVFAGNLQYEMKLNVHHLIPLNEEKMVKHIKEDIRRDKQNILNSPLNLTYISEEANNRLGYKSLKEYIEYLDSLDIKDHAIPEGRYMKEIYNNDYKSILSKRYELIRDKVKHHVRDMA